MFMKQTGESIQPNSFLWQSKDNFLDFTNKFPIKLIKPNKIIF